MTDKPWLQINISTAIVLVLVTGGITVLNAIPARIAYASAGRFGTTEQPYALDYGWPFVFYRNLGYSDEEPIQARFWGESDGEKSIRSSYRLHYLAADSALGIALLLLALTAVKKLRPQSLRDKPHRPWSRIRRSTAIVLLLVAGGFVCVNLMRTREYRGIIAFGWPFTCFAGDKVKSSIYWEELIGNLLIGALILSAVAIVCELMTRRGKYG